MPSSTPISARSRASSRRPGCRRPEVKALSLKHAAQAPVIAKVRELARLESEAADLAALLDDAEMGPTAHEELPSVSARAAALEQEILLDLLPKDPVDEKNAYLRNPRRRGRRRGRAVRRRAPAHVRALRRGEGLEGRGPGARRRVARG